MPNSHPELNGEKPQSLYTVQLRRPGQTFRERLSWVLIGLSLGLGVASGFFLLSDQFWPWVNRPSQSAVDNPFQQGFNQAMAAAELTQTAKFKEEWVEVVLLWQQAIAQMKAVPPHSPNYALARQKIDEYDRNLEYAQSNVNSRPTRTPTRQNYWTIGSDRDWVLAVQGTPTQVIQYHGACSELLRYGNSLVELNNGYVKQYSNLDGNLRVLADVPVATSTQATATAWTLGSPREVVLQLQGLPSRTDRYATDRRVTLYYGNSSVMLDNGHVTGYLNLDQNLKVSTALADPIQKALTGEQWSLGSSRAKVLKVQRQTPRAVSRNNSSCEEIFSFGNSEVRLRQGFVVGYKNEGRNLQVR